MDISNVFPGLKIGMRVKRTYANLNGITLAGKIVKFKDVLDMDAIDDGASEEEATVKGGAFVVLLDEAVRPRVKNDDGSIRVIDEWDVDYDEAQDWVTA
jgi:hypothetical protein